ncbi:MAG: NDP-sugar synthase [Dehalococcoidia bacterium]|nr:NDP-sugar synthase [Dehalococcoidia bacterium]
MQAVILVGGLGTRLRPLTWHTPKALVPVLNRPFLEHALLRLKSHGVGEVVLAISNLADEVERCLGDGSYLGMKISYAHEKTAQGTAGAVKNAAELIKGTFFVLNGDIFTDLDYTAMLDFHRHRQASVTIALTPVEDPTQYGLVETTPEGRVKRFLEKPGWNEITTNMINAGTYVMEPEVLDLIPSAMEYSFERQLFPEMLAGDKAVFAFPSAGYWIDIGSPAKYRQLNFDLLTGRSGGCGDEVITGEGSNIAATAVIRGPVLIGRGCDIGERVLVEGPAVIGANCRIAGDAVVSSAIVWDGVAIGDSCRVSASIIANGCRLEAGSRVEGAVLGDHVRVNHDFAIYAGESIEPGTGIG